jgi:hypothetical protein
LTQFLAKILSETVPPLNVLTGGNYRPRFDDDEQRDQAGDEKRPMSRQEARFHDGNRLAGEG